MLRVSNPSISGLITFEKSIANSLLSSAMFAQDRLKLKGIYFMPTVSAVSCLFTSLFAIQRFQQHDSLLRTLLQTDIPARAQLKGSFCLGKIKSADLRLTTACIWWRIFIIYYSNLTVHCVRKKDKIFFVTSTMKLGRFWWNFVCSFLNKFTAKWYKKRRWSTYVSSKFGLVLSTHNWELSVGILPFSNKEPVKFAKSPITRSRFAWLSWKVIHWCNIGQRMLLHC